MSTVRRDWSIKSDGSLLLKMSVEVNGVTLATCAAIGEDLRLYGSPPPAYIERQMRHDLMRDVERRLFGALA